MSDRNWIMCALRPLACAWSHDLSWTLLLEWWRQAGRQAGRQLLRPGEHFIVIDITRWHVSLWALAADCPNAILVKFHIQTRELCLDICCWTLLHFRSSYFDSLHVFLFDYFKYPIIFPSFLFPCGHQSSVRNTRFITSFTNLTVISLLD